MSSSPGIPCDVPSCTESRGALLAVLTTQFLSAFADNALLFGAIALLRTQHYPQWAAPLLQEFFVAAYILLAPFVGPFSDATPKGRVLLVGNLCKLIGTLGIVLGINPFIGYGIVGLGAAAYSPAKYGILSEIVEAKDLIKANGVLESTTIAAVILGVVAGGVLADWSVTGCLTVIAMFYAISTLTALLIPRLPAAHRLNTVNVAATLREFAQALRTLSAIPEVRLAIGGTSLFWGAVATLRFLLIAWVPVALSIKNIQLPAYLNAAVAIGVVLGAALAARFVTLRSIRRALPAGVLLGLSVCLLALMHEASIVFVLITLAGVCGGYFVVPLNSLLQARGHESVGAGHAIAAQNFADNLSMLLMLGGYALALREGAGVTTLAIGFGLLLAGAVTGLLRYERKIRGQEEPCRSPA